MVACIRFGFIDVIRHRSDLAVFDAMRHAANGNPSRRVPTASEAAARYAMLCLPTALEQSGTTVDFESGRFGNWMS